MYSSTSSGQRKILIATGNPAKFSEIKEYLKDLPVEFVSLRDMGIHQEVEEDTKTYEGNSQKKALFYSRLSGLPALSDDGGVEIEALGGLPGVESRYFGGPEGKDEDIIKKMTDVLKSAGDKRNAVFVCVNTLALPTGEFWSTRGEAHLQLAEKSDGKFVKGFPFRSFLVLPNTHKYFHDSELTPEEQEIYNHRYKALMKLKAVIKEQLHLSS